MKLFFMSDIHGSAHWLSKALERFDQEQADTLVILGDLLYHGPRNPLPADYNPQAVAEALNARKDKILTVRGNCEAEVDQMMLAFPVMADYAVLFYEGRRIFATHGHNFSMDNLPPLTKGDVFIQGHTHVPVAEKRGDLYVLNPGSISIPKENYPNSYAVLENNRFTVKDFAGQTIKELVVT